MKKRRRRRRMKMSRKRSQKRRKPNWKRTDSSTILTTSKTLTKSQLRREPETFKPCRHYFVKKHVRKPFSELSNV